MKWIHLVVSVTYLPLFCMESLLQGETLYIIKTNKKQNEKYSIKSKTKKLYSSIQCTIMMSSYQFIYVLFEFWCYPTCLSGFLV